jgi:hypothetical protein
MVTLEMEVARAPGGRLDGTLRHGEDGDVHHFSGTLELMRALEDLVPACGETTERSR